MAERRTVGEILKDFGRITEADVARALEHQRDHGGFFGEALVACGLVSQEELEFGLASQFDLPYVFPEAESVDPEAAALVSPEWALAHLVLPILRTESGLTVVVESPLETAAVEELRARTDLEIELALASGAKIRELIRQVYARASAADTEERQAPVQLSEAFAAALEAGAGQFGISTRGTRSRAWWNDAGTIRRRLLEGDWTQELNRILSPAPSSRVRGQTRAEWEAQLSRAGTVSTVGVMYLADESGHEYLFRPRPEEPRLTERFAPPSSGVLSEVRLLTRSGSARFIVTTEPAELGHDILPHIPALVLDPSWRSIYVCTEGSGAAQEAFSLALPEDPGAWGAELERLRAFHFDVVTVDLPSHRPDWAATALDVASVAFILWPADADTRPAHEAGIRWALRIAGQDHRLEWALEPLHL